MSDHKDVKSLLAETFKQGWKAGCAEASRCLADYKKHLEVEGKKLSIVEDTPEGYYLWSGSVTGIMQAIELVSHAANAEVIATVITQDSDEIN